MSDRPLPRPTRRAVQPGGPRRGDTRRELLPAALAGAVMLVALVPPAHDLLGHLAALAVSFFAAEVVLRVARTRRPADPLERPRDLRPREVVAPAGPADRAAA